MTKAQRYTLLIDSPKRRHVSLWTKACQAQGWNKNDREFRIQKLSEAVGRPIESTTELNNTNDIDRVFAFLRACVDNLEAARELDNPEMGESRRLRFKLEEVKSELRAFVENVPAYVAEIIKDKFNHGISRRVEILTEDDLSADQLHQLLITLNRCVKEFVDDAKTTQCNLEAEDDQPTLADLDGVTTIGGVDKNVPF